MRTTLTLEDDLARELKELSHRTRKPFKEIVNETLRRGLEVRVSSSEARQRFRVEASHCGFVPGVDPGKLNQLSDELEAADFVAEHDRK